MKTSYTSRLGLLIICAAMHHAAAQEGGAKLFTFDGGSDGAGPESALTLAGGTLYGTAYNGANGGTPDGYGTVFSIRTNGSDFTVLYAFGGTNDGSNPSAGLTLAGATLYGTSSGVEAPGNVYGSVFRIKTNGTGFTVLHTFTNGTDGANPYGGLVLSGSTLYGMANSGGANNGGTVYKVSTNGSSFTVLYALGSDGYNPYGGLVLSGSTLYGVLSSGGTSAGGTLFKISTSGTGFTVLHPFTFGSDGGNPFGTLVLSGSTLYGTAIYGGCPGSGTVFKVSTSGSDFTVLHCFTGGSDGANPVAGLTLSGSTLYGTAQTGGDNYQGTVFSLNTAGGDFTVLHTFNCNYQSGYYDGISPASPVTVSGNTIYGATQSGGGTTMNGMLYSLYPCSTVTLSTLNPATTYMNFDSVNTSGGKVDATSYLASYGITLTNVSPAGTVFIANNNSDGCDSASSAPNFLTQDVGGSPPCSYTLLFNSTLQSVSFTQCAVGGNCESPIWTATAYAGTNVVDSVGVCCIDSDTGQPPRSYTLNGPGITSLTVSANGEYSSAIASVPLDDFYMATALTNPVFGEAYSQTITAAGGTPPYSFAVTSGTLPNGLGLSSDGVLSGTPASSGTFNFTITAADVYGCANSAPYSFSIPCPTISVAPATLPDGIEGAPYSTNVAGIGGSSPYTFSIVSGSLPNGLSLDPRSGIISGTPATGGTFNFTIEATDADNCIGSTSCSIFICVPPTVYNITGGGGYCSGGSGVPVGLSGSQPGYGYYLSYEGFPFEFANGTGGPISFGNQAAAGTYTVFAYSDTGSCSSTMNGTATVWVNPVPIVSAGQPQTICAGSSVQIGGSPTASGGAGGGYTYSWTPSAGLNSPTVANPVASPASTTTYNVTVSDANGCNSAESSVTVTVNPLPPIPIAGNNGPILAGGTLNLTASTIPNVNYSWTGPNGFTSSVQNPSIPNATAAATGTYFVTATTNNGCASAPSSTTALVSSLRFTSISRQSNGILLTWIADGGTTNQMQIAPILGKGGYSFANLGAQIILPGSNIMVTNFLDSNATTRTGGLYRIQLVP